MLADVDMHPAQLNLSAAAVTDLVHRQFPQWRDVPVTAVPSTGTVNELLRIGDELVARFPVERSDDPDGGRARLVAEAAVARELLGRTRFATPEPVAIGEPGPGYPQAWSVQTWLTGTVASDADPGSSVAFARDLAEFIRGVRSIEVAGRTFGGAGRGGDLRSHDGWVDTCLERSEGLLDVPRLRALWKAVRELPRRPGGDVMNHGDLIPGNVLLSGGRLSGVLDVGGLGPADPALDLVAAWHLLDAEPRRVLRAELDVDDLQWRRGMAWALEQAIGLVWYYQHTNPTMSATGRRTLDRILADG
jgi:aminoglycoside phosphotransferase (APT) family kinase protein